MRIAITRKVGPSVTRCELTHLARVPIDVALAMAQHRAYEDCLSSLGCKVRSLPPEPDLADSVFVEDAALVLDELAVIARPGAESRRGETSSIGDALQPYRPTVVIEAPATLDGGDVLRIDKQLFVGVSGRTNLAGLAQLQTLVAPFGYTVEAVQVQGCLHLKSAITQVGWDLLLINPEWVARAPWREMRFIEVAPDEPAAANALLLGDTVIYPAAYPKTQARLEENGVKVVTLEVSELAKAEGGVTCCSLIFETLGSSKSP